MRFLILFLTALILTSCDWGVDPVVPQDPKPFYDGTWLRSEDRGNHKWTEHRKIDSETGDMCYFTCEYYQANDSSVVSKTLCDDFRVENLDAPYTPGYYMIVVVKGQDQLPMLLTSNASNTSLSFNKAYTYIKQ